MAAPTATISGLTTPVVLLDRVKVENNIRTMQLACDAAGVKLWPHIKTHKMVEVARRQLAAGAEGLTCAKLGEAEAMLPSGVKRIFIAHSLVDTRIAPRLAALFLGGAAVFALVKRPVFAAYVGLGFSGAVLAGLGYGLIAG